MACSQKIKTDPVQVKEISIYDVEDDVSPPPPDLISEFKTLQDWLFDVCKNNKPEKSIAKYKFGLFESQDEHTIFLAGVNTYDEGKDHSRIRIEFEPSNMYFKLPKGEFDNLDRRHLLEKLASQLTDFTKTEKFKNSFLSKASAIVFVSNGQTIWSK